MKERKKLVHFETIPAVFTNKADQDSISLLPVCFQQIITFTERKQLDIWVAVACQFSVLALGVALAFKHFRPCAVSESCATRLPATVLLLQICGRILQTLMTLRILSLTQKRFGQN